MRYLHDFDIVIPFSVRSNEEDPDKVARVEILISVIEALKEAIEDPFQYSIDSYNTNDTEEA